MTYHLPPDVSKLSLDRIGDRIRMKSATDEDLMVFEQWRASHLYVINTFQAALRGRRSRQASKIIIAQRLKRRPTIFDKLAREPRMNLSRMHDIAGCRMIFENIHELQKFREQVLGSRASHKKRHDNEKYDYIQNPKATGYRGIHDVYRFSVSSKSGKPYENLSIELQYRTLAQHAWATAVEINDLTNGVRLKFNEGAKDVKRQFAIASELIAREIEKEKGPLFTSNIKELKDEFQEIESRLGTIKKLKILTSSSFKVFAKSSKYFILINYIKGDKSRQVTAFGFSNVKQSVKRYEELEAQYGDEADVVLIGSKEQDTVRLAYTNYFSDATAFIKHIDKCLGKS